MAAKKAPPRNSFVKAMTLKNKTQIFHHKTDERGGSRNYERELMEEYDPALIGEEEPEFKSFHCGSCSGGMVEMVGATNKDIRIVRYNGKLIECLIPNGVLIPKCNQCDDTFFSIWDSVRVDAAIFKSLDERIIKD